MSKKQSKGVDYQNSLIYKLCCLDPNITDIYVGSTTNFQQRKKQHKWDCHNINANATNRKYNTHKYQFIRENGGWDNWNMIQLYKFPCANKRELHQEEDRCMNELKATLNMYRAFITQEDKILRRAKWTELNKDKVKQQNKEYNENNKEKRRLQQQQRRATEEGKRKEAVFRDKYKEAKNERYHLNKEAVRCECGCEVLKCNLNKHKQSIKHKLYEDAVNT